MHPFKVTIPNRQPVTVHAATALEAVIAVLNQLGLRYNDTHFTVQPAR